MAPLTSDRGESLKHRSPEHLPERWFLGGAAAITLVAFLLRVYGIGAQELWLDEAASFHKATSPTWLLNAAFQENTPPLYYLMLRAWLRLAGDSEAAVRFPSALFGTLFVPVAIWIGREMFNRQVGLWSGLFAAVNPIHVYYSQEARAYALLVSALALTYATLWRALQGNTSGRWVLFSTCALIALYSHYSAVLGLLPTALLLILWSGERHRSLTRLRYAAVSLLSVLMFLPWVLESFVWRTHPSTGAYWIPLVWARTPPPARDSQDAGSLLAPGVMRACCRFR